MVPTSGRATEFCSETTQTGKVVPRTSANAAISDSRAHSGKVVSVRPRAHSAAQDVPIIATRL